jgi:hypothetical protein
MRGSVEYLGVIVVRMASLSRCEIRVIQGVPEYSSAALKSQSRRFTEST